MKASLAIGGLLMVLSHLSKTAAAPLEVRDGTAVTVISHLLRILTATDEGGLALLSGKEDAIASTVIPSVDMITCCSQNISTALSDNDALLSTNDCNDILATYRDAAKGADNFYNTLGAKETHLSSSDKLQVRSSLRAYDAALNSYDKYCPGLAKGLAAGLEAKKICVDRESTRDESEKQSPMVNVAMLD